MANDKKHKEKEKILSAGKIIFQKNLYSFGIVQAEFPPALVIALPQKTKSKAKPVLLLNSLIKFKNLYGFLPAK